MHCWSRVRGRGRRRSGCSDARSSVRRSRVRRGPKPWMKSSRLLRPSSKLKLICPSQTTSRPLLTGFAFHLLASPALPLPSHHMTLSKGVARIWFRGGPTYFGGGARPPIFRLRPQITRVPPYVLLATPGFRGGGGPPRPPPLATPLTLSLPFLPLWSSQDLHSILMAA